jgi:hypothetical protein
MGTQTERWFYKPPGKNLGEGTRRQQGDLIGLLTKTRGAHRRTHRQTARWYHKPTFIFQNKDSRLITTDVYLYFYSRIRGYSQTNLRWGVNKRSNEKKMFFYTKNMYILKLLLNIVTAGTELLVVSGSKFSYALLTVEYPELWILPQQNESTTRHAVYPALPFSLCHALHSCLPLVNCTWCVCCQKLKGLLPNRPISQLVLLFIILIKCTFLYFVFTLLY